MGAYRYLLCLMSTFLLCTSPEAAKSAVVKLENRVNHHIEKLETKYPLKRWTKQVDEVEKELSGLKSEYFSIQSHDLAVIPFHNWQKFEKCLAEVKAMRTSLINLIQSLETESIVEQTIPRTIRIRNRAEAGRRARLLKSLNKNENRRTRKKKKLLEQCELVLDAYKKWQADWMFLYARKTVFQAIKNKFHAHQFTQNHQALVEAAQRAQQISQTISSSPLAVYDELDRLKASFPAMVTTLVLLEDGLAIDSLYQQVFKQAALDSITFNALARKKIKTLLPSLSEQNRLAVEKQRKRWLELDYMISQTMEHALEYQGELEMRKARKAQYNRELTAMMLSEDRKIQWDKSLDKALSVRPGKLRNSTVGSARNKSKAKVDSYYEQLAYVGKLNFDVKCDLPEIERIYDNPKEVQSLYLFMAEQGHPDKNDLREFVHEVALLSFGGTEEFLSYRLPTKWVPNKKIRWQSIKNQEKEKVQNREFTFVQLVTEAHRTRPREFTGQYVKKIYTPANMILIFQPGGRVKRYQTFADISKLRINPSDLSDGQLYYKFLNYSVSGEFIHLNGIDHEIKMATLN